MTTADLVNLVVSRLDSMQHSQDDFREEVRKDVEELKTLARATNGRVTELERQKISEHAKLQERQRIDKENAENKEKRVAPVKQVLISVAAGVLLAGSLAALSQAGVL